MHAPAQLGTSTHPNAAVIFVLEKEVLEIKCRTGLLRYFTGNGERVV